MNKKIAILISGSGSNMRALIEASLNDKFPATIELVISNNSSAGGLLIAKKYGVRTRFIDRKIFDNNEDYDKALSLLLKEENIDIVCAAGYMKIFTKQFVEIWKNKIINIHPSLLPDYKGLNTHKRVLHDHQKRSGCTTHIVEPELDSGPILMQATVPVKPEDTVENLAKRVLVMEHIIYPLTLKRFILRVN
ncbi:MAG: phosphoribosylglycinamide formyltransferase [Rhodobiaceae bacterium]|nr:phosphoribosylglycinamide formyltransferase [Rhodobiaceae bacterium]RPF97931.1 MAG: phosphoribosylglycinamide formyltransferase [Rhizobiales bacterium TMED227]|tara:strand:- start:375 stop:950 length:576 start_codon:yes stop_codon:yes gene_type:complete